MRYSIFSIILFYFFQFMSLLFSIKLYASESDFYFVQAKFSAMV